MRKPKISVSYNDTTPSQTETRMLKKGSYVNVVSENFDYRSLDPTKTGKWIIRFPNGSKALDASWQRVQTLIQDGVTHEAKYSPINPEFPDQVLIVYTRNTQDIGDIVRVYRELLVYGVVDRDSKIEYKADQATMAGSDEILYTSRSSVIVQELSRLCEEEDFNVENIIKHFKANTLKFIQNKLNIPLYNAPALADKIGEYNESLKALFEELSSLVSKTDKLVHLHNQVENNRARIIALLQETAKLKVLAKTRAKKRHYSSIKAELNKILENWELLHGWIESIVPKPSFNKQPSIISSNPSSLAMTYVESLDHDNSAERDREYVIKGQGLPLPSRLQREKLDPKHRAWGTLFPTIKSKLGPLNDSWAKSDKLDDLTVELEFNDEFRKIDRSFNPETFKFPEDADKPETYNAFNRYFTAREALKYVLMTKGYNKNTRKLVDSNNQVISTGNQSIFVMDMQGNLYVVEDGLYQEGKRIGHQSFTAGEPVACAGNITIVNGKITAIDNNSGHYQPTAYSLHRVLNALNSREVLADNFKVRDFSLLSDFECTSENGAPVRAMSLDQFNGVFNQKMGEHQSADIDLSEKANPTAVMKVIEKINRYLSERAKKTNGLISSLTGQYSGADYYKRRFAFFEILKKMATSENVFPIYTILSENSEKFKGGFSHKFSDLLIELRKAIEDTRHKGSLFKHPCLKDNLAELMSLYSAMFKMTDSFSEAYSGCCLFGKVPVEEIQGAKANKVAYKFLLEKASSKEEFLEAKEQLKAEALNVKYY